MDMAAVVRKRIEQGLPDSMVEVQDPEGDGVHLKAIVTCPQFEGKSLLEQHRMVYKTLEEELKEALHALSLETKVR